MAQNDFDKTKIARKLVELGNRISALAGEIMPLRDEAGRDREVSGSAFAFGPDTDDSANWIRPEDERPRLVRRARPPLPDPRLVRKIIRQRQLRSRFFDPDLFADPAWEMLLDLTAARAEHTRVSVTSLCIASGVPPTTALRYITLLMESGLLDRSEDSTDRRRAFLSLSDKASDAMAGYFRQLGSDALDLV